MVFVGPSTTIRNLFLGIGRNRTSQFLSFCSSFLALAVPALILSGVWGLKGVWAAFLVSDVLVLLGIWIVFCLCRGRLKPETEALIGKNAVRVPPEDMLEVTVHTVEEVLAFSLKANDFCRERNYDLKTRLHTSLAIEEMGTNVVEHGFDPHSADNFLKIRVFPVSGKLIISLMDKRESL